MLKDPFHWFPNPAFGTILGYAFLLISVVDTLLPRLFSKGHKAGPVLVGDRWSFALIYLTEILSLVIGFGFRYLGIAVVHFAWQYIGLVIMLAGAFLRFSAMVLLGRFFSRVVEIEDEHKLITAGPYRWIRHPAYTGMILIFTGLNLGLGSWIGAFLGFVTILAGTLYRINVEEKVLLQNFGEEYRTYRARTWLLFPGL